MTRISTTTGARADIMHRAPHPLAGGREPRAARRAEGAPRPAPSAHPHLTAASDTARAIVEAMALGVFMAALLIWTCVLAGRI